MNKTNIAQQAMEDMREYYERRQLDHQPSFSAIGECFYCGAGLTRGQRWCDSECRDKWNQAQARRT